MKVSISFSEIYEKAIGLFDDPKITQAYETNKIQFNKLMYVYFQNSISLFNNPLSVIELISNYQEPKGQMEIFQGDGETNSFTLDKDFQIIEGSEYLFTINGVPVINVEVNEEEHKVIFPEKIPMKQEVSIEQYFSGQFDCDVSQLGLKSAVEYNVINQIKDILARLLVKSWGENTRNFLLDIQNILTDSDFNVHSASASLKAKDSWVKHLNTEILQYQNKLGWNIKMFKS